MHHIRLHESGLSVDVQTWIQTEIINNSSTAAAGQNITSSSLKIFFLHFSMNFKNGQNTAHMLDKQHS